MSAFPAVTLTIKGVATSKKTNARYIVVGGMPRLIPSAKYVAYEKAALAQLADYAQPAIESPCHVSIRFYRDNRSDVDNLVGGLLDILQKAKVIKNDGLVMSIAATKSGKCDGDPRAEVFIVPYPVAA